MDSFINGLRDMTRKMVRGALLLLYFAILVKNNKKIKVEAVR
jgi:hypothetical protein